MKRLLIIGAFILALPVSGWCGVNWQRLDTSNFIVFFPEDEGPGAMVFGQRAEKIRTYVLSEMGQNSTTKINVYLAPDRGTFDTLQPKHHAPEWSVGTAIAAQETIVMFSPRGSLKEGVRADDAEVFAHELAHLYLADLLKSRSIPRWLQEGLAQMVARQWERGDALRLTLAVLVDRLIPLSALMNRWPEAQGPAHLAYAEAFSFTLFLRKKQYLAPMLSAMNNGRGAPEALTAISGKDLRQLEEEWRAYLKENQTWVLLSNQGCLWTFAALMAFAAFFLLKLRRRRQYEALDDEQ